MFQILNSGSVPLILYVFMQSAFAQEQVQYRHPFDKGVRFGYQNPIRVAPTIGSTINTTPSTVDDNIGLVNHPNLHHSASATCRNAVNARFHTKTQKCYVVGDMGPCGKDTNMVFYALPNDNQRGECDCIRNGQRPIAYHPATDKCYFAYQQAYCDPKQWLVFDVNKKPICDLNPCWAYGKNEWQWDWTFNGDDSSNSMTMQNTKRPIVPLLYQMVCARLGSACERNGNVLRRLLSPDQTSEEPSVAFHHLETEPRCLMKAPNISSAPHNKILEMDCRPGSKLNVINRC